MRSTRFWVLLLGGALLLCVLPVVLLLAFAPEGTEAHVYQDGVCTAVFPLDTDTVQTFTDTHGGKNVMEISGGKVRISRADCPDKVCVNRGWTDSSAVPIVCLPHGLVIEIKGGDKRFDAAAG